MANAWHPHVCIVDLQMPKVDGFELAQQLRQQPWATDIVLIAHTGVTTRDVRRRAHEVGFDCYFTKPTEPQELLQVIREQATKHIGNVRSKAVAIAGDAKASRGTDLV